MKFLCLLLGLMAMLTANAQLQIRTDKPIPQVKDSLYAFFNKNNFEYALVTYPFSNWFAETQSYSCIIKQKGKWYLAVITSVSFPEKSAGIYFRQAPLTAKQARILTRDIKRTGILKHTQGDLDKLPEGCTIVVNGNKTYSATFDLDYLYLLELKPNAMKALHYYNPQMVADTCYPYHHEYLILKKLTGACQKINDAVKAAGLTRQ